MKKNHLLIASALLTGLFSGCATNVGPGKVASDTAPMIITNAEKQNLWNDPGLFGPVPANLAAIGNSDCKAAGFKGAIGYHPHAKDVHGNEIRGGGFLCSNN